MKIDLVERKEVMGWLYNHYEVCKYYHPKIRLGSHEIPWGEVKSRVNSVPSVEAIPIKWIEEWMSKHNSTVAHMLRDWREENR